MRRCPKLGVTMELVRGAAAAGEKVLLFSPYKNMQRILQSALALTFRDILDGTIPVLNGDLAAPRRQAEVDQFNKRLGFAVLILSTDATGVDLNITGANHVIHYASGLRLQRRSWTGSWPGRASLAQRGHCAHED